MSSFIWHYLLGQIAWSERLQAAANGSPTPFLNSLRPCARPERAGSERWCDARWSPLKHPFHTPPETFRCSPGVFCSAGVDRGWLSTPGSNYGASGAHKITLRAVDGVLLARAMNVLEISDPQTEYSRFAGVDRFRAQSLPRRAHADMPAYGGYYHRQTPFCPLRSPVVMSELLLPSP